jgi:hypothetical protein
VDRAEAREELELERVSSCCGSDQRRRTELDFGSGEPFDDLHWVTTHGTAQKTRRVFRGSNVQFSLRLLGCAERLKDRWLLYTCVEGEITPLSRPFKTRAQAEKARDKYSENDRKGIVVGLVRFPLKVKV